jgi:hypothetical protein
MIRHCFHKIIYKPLKVIKEAFVALGVILGLCQGIVLFFPDISGKISNWSHFLAIILISIIFGRCRTWKVAKIDFKIPHTNTIIEIIFGDLFAQDGFKVIAVNEFFDSEIGDPVSDKTLHGILIEKHLQGKSFDEIVESQLSTIESEEVAEKTEGKKRRYPIGTTAMIKTDGNYIAFALSKTEPATCKAYCDVAIMWKALQELWKGGRIKSGGDTINIPLVGSGQSGVGLPTSDLLNIIILSAITETGKRRITGKIRVVLQDNIFEEIDLRDIKQYWKE